MTKSRTMPGGVSVATRIGKAIDHPVRIRALAALRKRELCVCELIELFGLAPSTVSKHMSLLSDSGLVDRRREGKWTYYSLPADPDEPVALAISLVAGLVDRDPQILEDRAALEHLGCHKDG